MAKEVYRIEIPIETKDEYSAGLKKAKEDFKGLQTSTKRAQGDVTKFQGSLRKTEGQLRGMSSRKYQLAIHAVDRASKVVTRVSAFTQRVVGRSYRFTLRAFDMATRTIGGIRRAITSIPALITIGLAVVGVGKLKEATVGAAMNFEQYETSMTHWLDGNTKKAKSLIGWMGQFADSTPFSSADLFPALSRGVGVADGNVDEAKRMLKISADMAALMPGKTPIEAMEALADARTGEFERMKEFGLTVSKASYKTMGGWSGFLDVTGGKFKDGAKKLSETSLGILMTLQGYKGALFRSMGDGILKPMKPRLDAINKWLANNQDVWGRWKGTVKSHGLQASEFLFSNLEKGFGHIRSRYLDNKEFMDMSFKGKIDFILGDINEWWSSKGKPAVDGWWESSGKPWASKTGLTIGEAIFEGIKTGLSKGLETIGGMWKNVGATADQHGTFSKETASSVGGASIATLGAGALTAMVLSPFITVLSKVFKGTKWGYDKTIGRGGNSTTPIPISPKPSDGKPTSAGSPSQPNKNKPVILDQYGKPLSSSNTAPKTVTTPKTPAIPKGVSKMLKRIPFLGTLFSIGAMASSSKEELPGTIGAVGGGMAGAKGGAVAGAALGSFIPVLGTAFGAAIGTILGGFGGAVGGEWLGRNWDLIKEKSSDAYSSVKESWGQFSGWYENSVSNPFKNMSIDAMNATVGAYSIGRDAVQQAWGSLSSSFQENVWNPLTLGAEIAGNMLGQRFDAAKAVASAAWSPVASWFDETVWSPLSTGSEIVGGMISGRFETSKAVVQAAWGAAGSWFEANVWGPLRAGVESVSGYFERKLDVLKAGAASMGTVVSDRTNLFKTGIEAGFNVLKNRGQQETGVKSKYANGGFINRPHVGLVGEAGPEMIIPLSSGRRNRAMELYQRTGAMLGISAYADGGMVGGAEPVIRVPNNSPVSSENGSYSSGSVSISMPVAIQVDGSSDKESIIQQVINEFGSAVIPQLREALSNMA